MEMHKEELRRYLHDDSLIQSIEYKAIIENIRTKLRGVLPILKDVSLSREALKEIREQYIKYEGLCKCYADMLKSEWGVDLQQEKIILKYIRLHRKLAKEQFVVIKTRKQGNAQSKTFTPVSVAFGQNMQAFKPTIDMFYRNPL